MGRGYQINIHMKAKIKVKIISNLIAYRGTAIDNYRANARLVAELSSFVKYLT
jgi:hypothetical protein